MRVTVVETAEFIRQAKGVLTDTERMALIDILSEHPEAGVSLGGGVRKVRFGREGSGKSGGFRSVHFYAPGRDLPVILMTVFAKNVKANLTPREQAVMVAFGERLAAGYGGKT